MRGGARRAAAARGARRAAPSSSSRACSPPPRRGSSSCARDRAEAQAIADVVRRLAMAAPGVGFTLDRPLRPGGAARAAAPRAEPGDLFDAPRRPAAGAARRRTSSRNALPIDAEREGVGLGGFAALPTFSRGAAVAQYLFVNGRPVRDKLLARRAARRLRRPAGPRPPSGGGAVPRLRSRGGRRQRPPGQGRGAVPRPRPRPRPGRRRAAPGAGRRRPPRLDAPPAARMLGAFRPAVAAAAAAASSAASGRPAPARRGFAEPGLPGSDGLVRRGSSRARRARGGPGSAAARRRPGAAARDLRDRPDRRRHGDRRPARRARAAGLRAAEGRARRRRAAGPDAADPRGRRARRRRLRAAARGRGRARRGSGWSSSRSAARRSACARPRRCSARSTARGCSPTSPTRWPRTTGAGSRRGSTRCSVADVLPRLGAGRAADARRGDERAAARDGGDAALRPVQPRPADLGRAEARRHRAAVRAAMITVGATTIALDDPRLWAAAAGLAAVPDPLAGGRRGRRARSSRWRGTWPSSTARCGR